MISFGDLVGGLQSRDGGIRRAEKESRRFGTTRVRLFELHSVPAERNNHRVVASQIGIGQHTADLVTDVGDVGSKCLLAGLSCRFVRHLKDGKALLPQHLANAGRVIFRSRPQRRETGCRPIPSDTHNYRQLAALTKNRSR